MDIQISWCCVERLSGEMQCSYLLTPDREPTADQVLCGEPMSFIGLTYVWVRGDLQGQKGLENSCVTKAQPRMGQLRS